MTSLRLVCSRDKHGEDEKCIQNAKGRDYMRPRVLM